MMGSSVGKGSNQQSSGGQTLGGQKNSGEQTNTGKKSGAAGYFDFDDFVPD
jgi:hypothetical protein